MNKKNQWEVSIRKVDNGFICSYEDQLDDGSFKIEEVIFEEKESYDEDNKNELNTMKEMFLWVKDYFGVHWNKYSKENLDIKIGNEDD